MYGPLRSALAMFKVYGAWPVAECDGEAAECHRQLVESGSEGRPVPASVWIAPCDPAACDDAAFSPGQDSHWFEAAIFLDCVSALDTAARLARPGHNQGPLTWRVAFAALNEAGECLQTVAPLGADAAMVHTRLIRPESSFR
jgi:hypothetical protein